jgi:hypothetical protein
VCTLIFFSCYHFTFYCSSKKFTRRILTEGNKETRWNVYECLCFRIQFSTLKFTIILNITLNENFCFFTVNDPRGCASHFRLIWNRHVNHTFLLILIFLFVLKVCNECKPRDSIFFAYIVASRGIVDHFYAGRGKFQWFYCATHVPRSLWVGKN